MKPIWHTSLKSWRPRQHVDILHDGHMESGLFAWGKILAFVIHADLTNILPKSLSDLTLIVKIKEQIYCFYNLL
jgi:hypothetical protein